MMKTQVGHLCRPVITVDIDSSVNDLVKDVAWEKVSSAVVTDKSKKVVGVITERDILHAESLDMDLDTLKASDICSRYIIRIGPEDSIIGAAHMMIDHKVHHVLIMTGDYVEGMISTLDVLEQLLDRE